MTKGKQQLKARLDMLLWAITHSNAIPPGTNKYLRGKGYLYFPKSSAVCCHHHPILSQNTGISVYRIM